MRKQYFSWMFLVFGIVGVMYGAFTLGYHFRHGNGLNVASLVLLILGGVSLVVFGTFYVIDLFQKRKNKPLSPIDQKVEEVEEVIEEPVQMVKEEKPEPKEKKEYVSKAERSSYSYSSSSYSTIYVKQVGYGPILRVEGNRILDMRNNTYYRIENNIVKQEGYGPLYEIRGSQIKNAFGGYLYELCGSNINKVYGGYYASISGNYITLYDLSVKYEMTDSLSKNQTLAIVALLFGKY